MKLLSFLLGDLERVGFDALNLSLEGNTHLDWQRKKIEFDDHILAWNEHFLRTGAPLTQAYERAWAEVADLDRLRSVRRPSMNNVRRYLRGEGLGEDYYVDRLNHLYRFYRLSDIAYSDSAQQVGFFNDDFNQSLLYWIAVGSLRQEGVSDSVLNDLQRAVPQADTYTINQHLLIPVRAIRCLGTHCGDGLGNGRDGGFKALVP